MKAIEVQQIEQKIQYCVRMLVSPHCCGVQQTPTAHWL